MARPKKSDETVVENVIQTEETENVENKEEVVKEKEKNIKKIFLPINTPYLSVPDINNNVAGVLNAGSVFEIINEHNSLEHGSFWEISGKRYINKAWNVEVF